MARGPLAAQRGGDRRGDPQGQCAGHDGGETETFEPGRHKDIDAEQLANLRRLLKKAGYGPDEEPT